ncbi:copper resistance protein NlpE N-terminal domain-containing protein [uncultured Proteiniphilum sp.]|uniref:copper resistance protein NlpE N-terminal domain-containing protein n=1 Tax=uncultured Proteiniphilum sp. TaxID=497637 RepID=UPI0026044DF1|nr:copper resistance protein NlpE N-terminal domain-containing protein [uncultured Proteiniphilum sp.]
MKKSILLLCIVVAALSACNTGKRSSNAQTDGTEVADPAHNSRNSLDWAGVYKGTLPCADCEGIEVEIRLNDDLSYEKVMIYMGKGDNRFSDNGRFEWDEIGSRIKLTSATSPKAANNWFLVGENRLFVLDTEGNRIESNFPPETYIFEKIDLDNVITEKYWKLIELNGKEITFAPEGQIREAHFILKNEDNRVIGNTGCNNMNGSYSLSEEENSIHFTPPATTRMACMGVDYEADYLDMFQTCDNYAVQNDTLTLRKEEAPLARFVAVYLR